MASIRSALMLLLAGGCGGLGLDATEDSAAGLFTLEPPDELSFGTVSPAGEGKTMDLVLTNVGQENVYVEHVVVTGNSNEAFALASDPSPLRLVPAQKIDIPVVFLPDATGSFGGTATVVVRVGSAFEMGRRLIGQGCADAGHDGHCDES
jgi:hypothetical protein